MFLFNGDNPYGVFQPSDCLGQQILIRGESDKLDRPEGLNIVQIGDILDADMYGQKLFPILKTLVAKNINFSFYTEMVRLVGHSIEVPCSKIKTADFSIIFDIHSVLQVKLGKDIADASSLITTHNNRILVSDILELAREDTAKSIQIRVRGANDAWHFVYKNDEECVYHVGFDF